MDENNITEGERLQIEQIRQLDLEELQIEEVEDLNDSSDDDPDFSARGYGSSSGELAFNTSLASLHTYLGEVEDTQHRLTFLDTGSILNIPLFHLEGLVLFPAATLPLRVVQPNFIAAVERALSQVGTRYIIGVVRVYRNPDTGRIKFGNIGTTAEIRQYRRLEDGSLNVVTRGQQRFYLKRRWIDVEGAPYGEIQVIHEDMPLRTPRDAVDLIRLSNLQCHSFSHTPSHANSHGYRDEDNESEDNSEASFECELSLRERTIHQSLIDSCCDNERLDESTSSDDDNFARETELQFGKSKRNNHESSYPIRGDYERATSDAGLDIEANTSSRRHSHEGKGNKRLKMVSKFSQPHIVSRAFWPHWVYQMCDSYCLAQKAADKWKQIVGTPSLESFVKKPDQLSFYIASKIPVSENTRQELLEIDGVSYRLQREIKLLENFDQIRCKHCKTVIARRSDMLVMSSDGPFGAYANPHGCVHEIMTLYKANGLALVGRAFKEYSWFPGYAWTITNCSTCETHMGWLFTATNKKLRPRSFWGIRSSHVADDTS